jgi:hypothetical protein
MTTRCTKPTEPGEYAPKSSNFDILNYCLRWLIRIDSFDCVSSRTDFSEFRIDRKEFYSYLKWSKFILVNLEMFEVE